VVRLGGLVLVLAIGPSDLCGQRPLDVALWTAYTTGAGVTSP
jgi:hypothetical protein